MFISGFSPSSAPAPHRAVRSRLPLADPPRGIVFPMLLAGILIIGVATAGVAELWTTQIKREKEEELLFRLSEIRRGHHPLSGRPEPTSQGAQGSARGQDSTADPPVPAPPVHRSHDRKGRLGSETRSWIGPEPCPGSRMCTARARTSPSRRCLGSRRTATRIGEEGVPLTGSARVLVPGPRATDAQIRPANAGKTEPLAEWD